MSAATTLELLWGTRQRPRRGPKPSLSLERIVAEAIDLADAEGLANLSMQRLAERIGCAKMALYRYVPGKTELTALMLDTAMGPAPDLAAETGESAEQPWRAQLRHWTVTVFHGMCAHPWMHEIAAGSRPLGPQEISWFEAALRPLADTTLTGPERLDTLALLASHARGLAMVTAGAADTESAMAQQLAHTLADRADRYPHTLAAFADTGPPGSRGNALEFGIDRILDGLTVLMTGRHEAPGNT